MEIHNEFLFEHNKVSQHFYNMLTSLTIGMNKIINFFN